MQASLAAALVTAALLFGGVAVAAGMGHPWQADHVHPSTPSEPQAPVNGANATYRHAHQYKHGPQGNMTGNASATHECPHDGFDFNLTWINGTVENVTSDGYVVVSTGNNTSLTLKIRLRYVDTATGYLVYGPWLETALAPGMNVTVLVYNGTLATGMGGLLGIQFDGRTLVYPTLLGKA